MVCLHWMTDKASLDATETSELLDVLPYEELPKSNVQY